MKNLLSIFAIGIVTVSTAQTVDRSKAPQAAAARNIELGKTESFTLDNGLKVFVVSNHKLPRVSWQLYLDLPPIKEANKAGTAELIGEMLEAGTINRTKIQMNEELDFMGASLTASSSGIFASSLTKHSEKLLDIFMDVLLNPAFPEDEFKKLKVKTNSGLLASKNNPGEIASRAGAVIRYGNHPYGEIMTEETLVNIELQDLKTFYSTWFKPNVAYLAIVGDITVEQAKALVNKKFNDWKKGRLPIAPYENPKAPEGTMVAFIDKPGAVQSVVNIHFPIELKPGTSDALIASVMNDILGGRGFSGRLMKNIREDKAYSYGSYATTKPDKYIGYFMAFADVRNEVTDSAIVQMLYEIDRMSKELVTQDELQLILNEMSGSFGRSLESPQSLANFALNIARYNLSADYYDTYLVRLNAITPEDIQRMAKRLLNTNRSIIQVVGNKEEVAPKLGVFAANGKVNEFDHNGKPVIELRPAPDGVTVTTVLSRFVEVVGGQKRISKLKSLSQFSEMEIPGMPAKITMELHKQANTMLVLEVKMAAQTMQKQVINGKKGYQSGMGAKGEMTAEELDAMQDQVAFVQEIKMLTETDKMKLLGIEQINGKDAYKIEYKKSDSDKSILYYDLSTGLKLRAVSITTTTGEDGKKKTDTGSTDFLEYMEVDGLMFPKVVTLDLAGQTLKATTTKVTVNPKFAKGTFDLK
jgi:predicted Zn-dependent peptidase